MATIEHLVMLLINSALVFEKSKKKNVWSERKYNLDNVEQCFSFTHFSRVLFYRPEKNIC